MYFLVFWICCHWSLLLWDFHYLNSNCRPKLVAPVCSSSTDKQLKERWANSRAENSHLPFEWRERAMLRFGRMHSLQMFASVHASFHNQFGVFPIQTKHPQAKPWQCRYRMAISYRLIERILSRLLILELVSLTAPNLLLILLKRFALLENSVRIFIHSSSLIFIKCIRINNSLRQGKLLETI